MVPQFSPNKNYRAEILTPLQNASETGVAGVLVGGGGRPYYLLFDVWELARRLKLEIRQSTLSQAEPREATVSKALPAQRKVKSTENHAVQIKPT